MNKFKLFIDILIPVAIGGIVGFIINPGTLTVLKQQNRINH